jgi:hypothetical protein
MSDHTEANGATIIVDKDCRITSFNEEAECLIGRRAEDVLGRLFCEGVWSIDCALDPQHTSCPWLYARQGRERRGPLRQYQVHIRGARLVLLAGAQSCTKSEGARGAIITVKENPPVVLW